MIQDVRRCKFLGPGPWDRPSAGQIHGVDLIKSTLPGRGKGFDLVWRAVVEHLSTHLASCQGARIYPGLGSTLDPRYTRDLGCTRKFRVHQESRDYWGACVCIGPGYTRDPGPTRVPGVTGIPIVAELRVHGLTGRQVWAREVITKWFYNLFRGLNIGANRAGPWSGSIPGPRGASLAGKQQ
jgi:hypothetical protein